MLAQVKQPIHVVLVPDIFPGVEQERRRLHARCGVTEIRVDRSIVPTLSVLRALSVTTASWPCRATATSTTPASRVPFFGREAFFPRGPLRVAMASGATVLPAFIVRLPDGRYRAIVEEPLRDRDRRATATRRSRRNLRRYVAILERYVREYPEQWYCFYPFWDDPSREGPQRRPFRALSAAAHEERVVVLRELLDVRQDLAASRSRRPRKALRQFSGVRKPWLGRVAASVATPVKFSRKLKTNST